MEADKVQHGGTHYVSEYQHWNFVADLRLDYYTANATKYITRHRKKNGQEDAKKAQHYIQKKIELIDEGRLPQPVFHPRAIMLAIKECAATFLTANDIDHDSDEAQFILHTCVTETMSELRSAVAAAERIIRSYEPLPEVSAPTAAWAGSGVVRSDVAALLEKKDYTAEGWIGDMQVMWKCNHCKATFKALEGMLPSQAHSNSCFLEYASMGDGSEPTVDYVRQ